MSAIESNYEKYIFDNAKVGIAICNAKDNRLEMINPAFADIHGYEPHELIGAAPGEVFAPECMLRLAEHENTPSCAVDDVSFETTHIKKDGSLVDVSVHITVIKDKNGDVKQRIANVTDISGRKQIEKELQKRELEYRNLAENLPDAIVRYDKEFRRVYVNPEWERINGLSSDEVIGKTPEELSGAISAQAKEFQNKLRLVALSGESSEWDFEFKDINGTIKSYSIRAIPEYDTFGNFSGILTAARNITKRKLEEEKRLDEQMHFFFEKQLVGMAITSPQKGWLKVNDKLCEILGYNFEEFQKFTWAQMTHPEDLAADIEQFERMLNGEIECYTLEKRFFHKNGTIVFTNLVVSCVRNDDKSVDYVLALIEDITTRVCAQEALHSLNDSLEIQVEQRTKKLKKIIEKLDFEIAQRKRQEELLRMRELEFHSLSENIPDNIARWDIQGNYLYINPVHERTLNTPFSEVVGKCITDIFPEHTAVIEAISHVLATGKPILNIRQTVPAKDGEIEIHEVSMIPERDEKGEIVTILGIGRDVTKQVKMTEDLAKKEQELRTIMEHTPDTVARYDKKCVRIYANTAFATMAGKSVEELLGKKPTHYYNSPQAIAYEEAILRVYNSSKEEEFEYTWPDADGVMITSLIHLVPEKDGSGNIMSVLATGRNISKLKEFEAEINKQKDFQESLLRGVLKAGLSLSVLENGKYIYTNNYEYAREYGYDVENFSETKPDMLTTVHPDDREKVMQMYKKRLAGEDVPNNYTIKVLRADGKIEENEISVVLVPNTDPVQTIVVTKDVTEQKNIEKRIEFMAHHDALTGLPNRVLAKDRAEQTLAHAKRFENKAAILFIDLDGFKTINDSLGHAIGDTMLKRVSSRLQGCVRASDTLSRQGGDEFLLILPDLHNINEVKMMADKVLTEFKKPFHIHNHTLSTSASIGIAMYPEHGENFEQLLQGADAAMYKAKETGKNNYCFFTQQMKHNLIGLFQMQNDLKKAIENKEFELHYQPQVDLRENRVVGVEALIRWQHPTQGMIPPMSFISIAESSGLIVQIGEWVIMEACRQAAMWNKDGKELIVAVNISAVQFQRGNLEAVVKNALAVTGLNPKYLELELTESILINDTENVLQTVQVIKELGIQLSIDDFGTGYSSLSYLKRFAVDKLKIDQSFVRDILKDKEDASIVRTIIQMAKSFNLKSIAEGVENQEVLDVICEFGCDEVQGYHFAKPMEAKEFENYYMYEF